jgi:hypothetical protein
MPFSKSAMCFSVSEQLFGLFTQKCHTAKDKQVRLFAFDKDICNA